MPFNNPFNYHDIMRKKQENAGKPVLHEANVDPFNRHSIQRLQQKNAGQTPSDPQKVNPFNFHSVQRQQERNRAAQGQPQQGAATMIPRGGLHPQPIQQVSPWGIANPNAPGVQGGATNAEVDIQKEARDVWADILASLDGAYATAEEDFQGNMDNADASASVAARRASEMNALMGGSVGGAYHGGQVQAQIEGQEMRNDVFSKHTDRKLGLQMKGLEMKGAWLQSRLEWAMMEKKHDLERELRAMISRNNLDMAEIQFGVSEDDPPGTEVPNTPAEDAADFVDDNKSEFGAVAANPILATPAAVSTIKKAGKDKNNLSGQEAFAKKMGIHDYEWNGLDSETMSYLQEKVSNGEQLTDEELKAWVYYQSFGKRGTRGGSKEYARNAGEYIKDNF